MPIDYNQDIAPLRQQYFPMLTGERAFDQGMKYRQEVLAPMQDRTMQIQKHSMMMKQQDLAYETQKLEIAAARQKTQSQLKLMERLPEIMEEFDDITRDSDSYAANKRLIKFQMDLLPQFKNNPLLANLFVAAGNSIKVDQIKRSKEDAKADAEEALRIRQMGDAASRGATDVVKGIAGEEISGAERNFIDMAEFNENSNEAAGVAAQRKAQTTLTAARFKEHENTLRGMTTMTEVLWNSMSDFGGEPENVDSLLEKASETFDLKQVDKTFLVRIYVDLMKRSGVTVNPVTVADKDTKNLYVKTLEKIFEFRLAYEQLGQAPTQSNAADLNDR